MVSLLGKLSSGLGSLDGAMGMLKRHRRYDIGEYHVRDVAALAEGGYAFVSVVEEVESGGMSRVPASPFAIARKPTKPRYALKRMIVQSREQHEEVLREVKALRMVRHHNIVELLAFEERPLDAGKTEALLLLPLFDRAMSDVIDPLYGTFRPPFDQQQLLGIALQAALGLHALHAAGLRHNDIKPGNVLLRAQPEPPGVQAVLTDLGSTSPARQPVGSRLEALAVQEWAQSHTTAPYRAPELYDTPSDFTVTEATDNWSFGCLLYAMAFASCPFENATEGVLTLCILNGQFSFPIGHGFSRDLCEVIARLLTRDPAQRATLLDTIMWIEALLAGERDPFEGQFTVADPVEEARVHAIKMREEAEREAALRDKLSGQLSISPSSPASSNGRKGPPRSHSRSPAPQAPVPAPVPPPANAFADFAAFGEDPGFAWEASDPPIGSDGFADFGHSTQETWPSFPG